MAYRTLDHSNEHLFKNRLFRLMTENGIYTAKDLAKKLYDNGYVSVNQKKESYDEPYTIYNRAIGSIEKKIQKHLNSDTPEKLQGEFVMAYCNLFRCSSDYLFGYINSPTHEITDINIKTGLSEIVVNRLLYYHKHSSFHSYINIINIILASLSFESALNHIGKYMDLVKTVMDLKKQRNDRLRKVFSEQPNSYIDDSPVYNWPYSDDLDKDYKEKESKMLLEEYCIDKNLKNIIQEIEEISKKQNDKT